MVQENPGFLAPRHRKYLSGEYDFSEHSNPSEFRREILHRIAGAERDWKLLGETDVDLISNLDLTSEKRNKYKILSSEKIERGIASAEAQKSLYLEEDLVEMDDGEIDEQLSELEENQEKVRDFISNTIAVALTEEGDDIEGFTDDQIQKYIEIIYPDRNRVIEAAQKM